MVYTENVFFEWDENKNLSNIKKHGIKFEDAILVFYDEYCHIEEDIRHSQTEEREYAIGEVNLVLVCITYTIRLRPFRNRIILARRATKNERTEYEKRKRIQL